MVCDAFRILSSFSFSSVAMANPRARVFAAALRRALNEPDKLEASRSHFPNAPTTLTGTNEQCNVFNFQVAEDMQHGTHAGSPNKTVLVGKNLSCNVFNIQCKAGTERGSAVESTHKTILVGQNRSCNVFNLGVGFTLSELLQPAKPDCDSPPPSQNIRKRPPPPASDTPAASRPRSSRSRSPSNASEAPAASELTWRLDGENSGPREVDLESMMSEAPDADDQETSKSNAPWGPWMSEDDQS